MKAISKYQSKSGGFAIEINDDYIGVSISSVPSDCSDHYELLSDIIHFIISMRSLGASADFAYHATNCAISTVKGVRFIGAC